MFAVTGLAISDGLDALRRRQPHRPIRPTRRRRPGAVAFAVDDIHPVFLCQVSNCFKSADLRILPPEIPLVRQQNPSSV